jgi:hypothetical protein
MASHGGSRHGIVHVRENALSCYGKKLVSPHLYLSDSQVVFDRIIAKKKFHHRIISKWLKEDYRALESSFSAQVQVLGLGLRERRCRRGAEVRASFE